MRAGLPRSESRCGYRHTPCCCSAWTLLPTPLALIPNQNSNRTLGSSNPITAGHTKGARRSALNRLVPQRTVANAITHWPVHIMQTVWKLIVKGGVLRLGWGNLLYGTHSRPRPLPDAALAGDGGRLRRPGPSGALHRGLRGWARPGGGRLCSGRAQTDRSAGLCTG